MTKQKGGAGVDQGTHLVLLRVPHDLYVALRRLKDASPGLSINGIGVASLRKYLKDIEDGDRLTREALADVDAGRVVDHQPVQAWAEGRD